MGDPSLICLVTCTIWKYKPSLVTPTLMKKDNVSCGNLDSSQVYPISKATLSHES
jgi:hypothetical protein